MSRKILIVDDEARMREVLSIALGQMGYVVHGVANGVEALAALETMAIDLVLTDQRMPRLGGRQLLEAIKETRPELPVVLMTAYGSVKDAVGVMKAGAIDYLIKPFDMEEVELVIANALRVGEIMTENQRLRAELDEHLKLDHVIGDSEAFRAVLEQVKAVYNTNANVLLLGESGTGKEMIAKAIHHHGDRNKGPFVAINCAAIPEGLLESELFGFAKGAFSGAVVAKKGRFEAANGGTLFLDEIGDMPLSLQAKILRVIQERIVEPLGATTGRPIDVRIIAATHRNPREATATGAMREDLYYRRSVYTISLPPLRDRRDDIAALAAHFVRKIAPGMGRPILGFAPASMQVLKNYAWPGNIRELENCVERAIIVAKGSTVAVTDLPAYLTESSSRAETPASGLPLDDSLAQIERRMIEDALRQVGGIQARAATILGISERSLWHRVK
ncbi:MAG: sigma-54-dependent Fis family transcriptional regulator, partial [Alphaproteobacteria bacterium]|nr:sigma-54-dependent Fis family transcriptional regulator [Alphaproteobacteria bacterium]